VLQSATPDVEGWRPRPGRCGQIFGAIPTKDGGVAPLRWGEEIGIDVLGTSGRGKTRGLVLSSLLVEDIHDDATTWTPEQRRLETYGYESVKIIVDPKGELWELTAGFRKSLGENVYCIDPFSKDPGVAKCNPFDFIRVYTDEFFRDCRRNAGWICEQMALEKPDYWDNTSIDGMAGFIAHNAMRAIVERDPKINSPAWLYRFIASFDTIPEAISAVLEYDHDPRFLMGWVEEEDGKATDRQTATCPWVTRVMTILNAKASDELSGVYGSIMQHLPIFNDPVLAANSMTSTFNIRQAMNDPNRSTAIYIRMSPADIDELRGYLRLLVNFLLYEILQRVVKIGGRSARGNLRAAVLWLEECAALNRLEQLQRAAAYARGLGCVLITIFQLRNQIETIYSEKETITGNQGLHLRYTPETHADAKALSEELGEFSKVVQERNVSGDRLALTPRDHLAESNRIETRRWLSPSEVRRIPKTKVLFFAKGYQACVDQYRYDENPILQQRSEMPAPKASDVMTKRPWCMEHLERELGPARYKIAISPAPDKYERNRLAAIEHENGCRVHLWETTRADTGAKLFFAQVWLPNARKPALDEKKGYRSYMQREEAVTKMLTEFDDRDSTTAKPKTIKVTIVKKTDDPLVAAAKLFAQSDRN
jgi:type IV secretory pathway TraG/TraD family ATPase VirD4